jgi:DNA repair protein RadC
MPTHPITAKFPVGKSARVTVATVREDVVPYNTDSPEMLYQFWQDVIASQPDYEPDKESLVVVLLTTRLRPYAWHRVSLGTISEVSAHPREIMRPVIVGGAYAFVLMHNHPSGDPSPSRADHAVTTRIRECAELFQIRFCDHVIAGAPGAWPRPYYSFREAGNL